MKDLLPELVNNNPNRFQPYREPFKRTLIRTCMIALAVGTIGSWVHPHVFSVRLTYAYAWMVWVLSAFWISFGGHFVELGYLNVLRPLIAGWSDRTLVLVRLGVWLIGGTFLFLGIASTCSLLIFGAWPDRTMVYGALRYGGMIFAAIELVPHTVLTLLGKPSFWNRRG